MPCRQEKGMEPVDVHLSISVCKLKSLDLNRLVNPFMTNGHVHHYHLDESTVIFRGIRSDFEFVFHFL